MDSTLTQKETEQVHKLFELGAHLGHKKNRLHPKARKYVYNIINGVSIIDLTKTVVNLEKAKNLLYELGKSKKVLLVVGTKKIASPTTADVCENNSIPYVTTKWLPGLLTNFDTIIKNVRKLNELKQQKESGELNQYVKHERMEFDKKIAKLQKFYGGLISLEKRPDALFVIDIKKEKNSIIEAKKNKIPVVAVVDTNSNPDLVDNAVVVNDDSAIVMDYVINELVQSYVKGRKEAA